MPPDAWRPAPCGLPRLQRGLLLLGLFATATARVRAAPYLALRSPALAALAVRTFSWTTESARASASTCAGDAAGTTGC